MIKSSIVLYHVGLDWGDGIVHPTKSAATTKQSALNEFHFIFTLIEVTILLSIHELYEDNKQLVVVERFKMREREKG